MTLGSKDIGIRKSQFGANTQCLCVHVFFCMLELEHSSLFMNVFFKFRFHVQTKSFPAQTYRSFLLNKS